MVKPGLSQRDILTPARTTQQSSRGLPITLFALSASRYFLRGLGVVRGLDRRVAAEEPLRLLDDWARLLGVGDEDLDDGVLEVVDRPELAGSGPTIRLEDDREVVLRLVGAGLTDFRTGAGRGAVLRDELGTVRRTLPVDALDGAGRVMEEDRPGIALDRLVAGDGIRLLLAGAVRTGVRLGT